MTKEIWKPCVGFEGLYEVSNLGNVRSLNYRNRIGFVHNLFLSASKQGYLTVHFKNREYKVHRLVATAFIPNPENKRCVNHLDGNKQNNNVTNLEWCTHSENTRHKFDVLGYTFSPESRKNCLSVEVRKLNVLKQVLFIHPDWKPKD